MSAVLPAIGHERLPAVQRINFRFSGQGGHAACLAGHDSGRLSPEVWDLNGPAPRPRPVRTREGETPWSVPIPTDDGNVLVCRLGLDGERRILLAVPATGGEEADEHELANVRDGGLGLVAGSRRGAAALAFRTREGGRTEVWCLSGLPEPPEPVAELPEPVSGGIWLDEDGTRLAVASRERGATAVLHLRSGTLGPLGALAAGEHLLLAEPRTGVLLTAAQQDGAYRLGVRHRDDDRPTAFPARLNAVEGTVTPLALDPAGRRLALSVTRGARSHLLIHDLGEDTTEEVGLPPGTLHPVAHWTTGGLHLVHLAPDHPPRVVTVPDHSPHVARVPDHPPGAVPEQSPRRLLAPVEYERNRWAPARTWVYDGPAGGIEAIVYGDPATSPQLVVALHGGPEAAWQLAFDPLFQCLAASGVAVVAPNQRGSTGYGAAHRDAVHGAWGVPDLADVVHLGEVLTAGRGPGARPPALYGASYGAYLALLATAARPDLWARAAAVAPFLSGRELYEDGPPSVRAMLDRLGGREEARDELGPRDLLRLAGRMRIPILLVHGELDPIIPVTHSRRLYERLLGTRDRADAEPVYLEVAGAGHDPLSENDGHVTRDRIVAFLSS
ncbi:alpha/beta hydrolase family protein [Sphaerisporangium viridialbum]|uniref:alpha/beta hydrolase family protein n=1 Tax=Sphaerisporangium viridialbum TaxID=46189 RepID=UPI003C74392B